MQVYGALLESAAGEQGARMTAMDNATRNAGDMINKLTLNYNRSRQAYITKELIEIISGRRQYNLDVHPAGLGNRGTLAADGTAAIPKPSVARERRMVRRVRETRWFGLQLTQQGIRCPIKQRSWRT